MVFVPDDPYQALNLQHKASLEEIKRSYRQLCKKYHPDTWSAPCFSETEKQRATEQFQKVSAAYEILSDANEKAKYDRNYKLGLYGKHGNYDTKKATTPSNKNNTPYNDQTKDNTTGTGTNDTNAKNNTPSSDLPPPPRTGVPPPLPRGWTTAKDPISGRFYYCQSSTGKSSWYHPSLNNNDDRRKKNMFGKQQWPKNSNDYHEYRDDDRYFNSRYKPEGHRFSVLVSLFLFPPIGILAAYHSIMVDRCWKNSEERDYNKQQQKNLAELHSKRASCYACFGAVVGIIFWIYIIFIREESEWAKDIHKKVDEWLPDDWNAGGR